MRSLPPCAPSSCNVLGIVGANLAGHHPGIALAFPALMLINATFFHVLPFALTRDRSHHA
jgi:hypothetical protein